MASVCEGTLRGPDKPARAGTEAEREIRSQLQLACANFEPIRHFLDGLGERLAREFGRSAALGCRGGMQPTAKNAFQVQYSLRLAGDMPLALVDKLEEIALAIPAQNWPSTFDALLDGWELAMKTCCVNGSSCEEH